MESCFMVWLNQALEVESEAEEVTYILRLTSHMVHVYIG